MWHCTHMETIILLLLLLTRHRGRLPFRGNQAEASIFILKKSKKNTNTEQAANSSVVKLL